MAQVSPIEWTDATWNPTRGCTKIAPGCAHCYAETFAERFRGVLGHSYEEGFNPRLAPEQLAVPFSWKKPRRIFVDSMSDLFHESFAFDYIAAVFAVMAITPRHTYQVLTKRGNRALKFFEWLGDDPAARLADAATEHLAYEDIDCTVANYVNGWSSFREHPDDNPLNGTVKRWPLPNVGIGHSIANQTDADKNVSVLLQILAAMRFLSVEPLIGSVSLERGGWLRPDYTSCQQDDSPMLAQLARAAAKKHGRMNFVDWVIVGGESGPGARPCNVEWIRSIAAQCTAAGVPIFVKQFGAHIRGARDGFLIDRYEMPDGSWRRLPLITVPAMESWVAETKANAIGFSLFHRKGGDPLEWPADLRVREFPAGVAA